MLAGKKILLAVCGSIAAYKVAFFVRMLKREGTQVKVIMTESAQNFITPLTFATLSKNPVFSSFFDEKDGNWHNHVALGMWADMMVVAPLSVNTLGKMANGICDNFLLATYLSARCPVIVVPAMDLDMYQHPSTQANLEKLRSYGHEVIEARDGELASGLSGQGRMAEPEELVDMLKKKFSMSQVLKGKKVLITSGPTFETIDSVRFIGNHSSGRMGTAIARSFKQSGAEVTMIAGPSKYLPEDIEIIHVTSAAQMFHEAVLRYTESDIVVFAAAVSDYRAAHPAKEKIKKKEAIETLQIDLVKNPDIAAELGEKKKHQFHVGFALETTQEKIHAKEKLKKKNFDLIVLNSLNDNGAGFQTETNKVTFFDKNNNERNFKLKHKTEVAQDIVEYVIEHHK